MMQSTIMFETKARGLSPGGLFECFRQGIHFLVGCWPTQINKATGIHGYMAAWLVLVCRVRPWLPW